MSKKGLFGSSPWDSLSTVLLALVLSVVVWVNAVYQNDRPRQDRLPDVVPIEILNAPSGLAVVNKPETHVSVEIKAFASSWDALTLSNFRATVDLQDLVEGFNPSPSKSPALTRR